MTIGEVAMRAGIHTSAIRYYEKAGLLMPPARTSGRRVYQQEVVHQLTIISVYKDLGFSLQEIGLLLNELPKDKSASARWSELAQVVERIHRDQLQLLGDGTGSRARSFAAEVWFGKGVCRDHAGGQRRWIPRRRLPRHSR